MPGFLRAPFGFESVRSAYSRLGSFDAGAINPVIRDLAEEATTFAHRSTSGGRLDLECTAYMRHVSQGW